MSNVIEHLGHGNPFPREFSGKAGGGQLAYQKQVLSLTEASQWDVHAIFPEGASHIANQSERLTLQPLDQFTLAKRFYQQEGVDQWSSSQLMDAYSNPETQQAFIDYIQAHDISIYSGHLSSALPMADGLSTHLPVVMRLHSMLSRYRVNGNEHDPDFAKTITDKRIALEHAALANPYIHFIFSTNTERVNSAALYAELLKIDQQALLDRMHHIPLGFDHFSIDPTDKKASNKKLREANGIPFDAPVSYVMGRREPTKKFHEVAHAFVKAWKQNTEMQNGYLILYGGNNDPAYEKIFEEASRETNGHIILKGSVSQQVGHGITGTCIIPGKETFSFVTGEAGISGNAIATTTDCPELTEITQGLEGAIQIDPSSSAGILQLYEEMQCNKLLERAQDNKQLATRYPWASSMQQHAQLLEKLSQN